MFGTIFPFLCVGLVVWYLVLILYDIQKGRETEKMSATSAEDEIDISEDVNEFSPVKIEKNPSRPSTETVTDNADAEYVYEDKTSLLDVDLETLLENLGTIDEEILRHSNITPSSMHRQVITDGMDSDEFCERIKTASVGRESILSDIIYQWDKAV